MIKVTSDTTGIFGQQPTLVDDSTQAGISFLVKAVKNRPVEIKQFFQQKGLDMSNINSPADLLDFIFDLPAKTNNAEQLIRELILHIDTLRQVNAFVDPITISAAIGAVSALIGVTKSGIDAKSSRTQAQAQLQAELLASQQAARKRDMLIGLGVLGGVLVIGTIVLFSIKKKK